MKWEQVLAKRSIVFDAVVSYARERREYHVRVCCDPAASEPQIRASQAAIEELNRLINMQQGDD